LTSTVAGVSASTQTELARNTSPTATISVAQGTHTSRRPRPACAAVAEATRRAVGPPTAPPQTALDGRPAPAVGVSRPPPSPRPRRGRRDPHRPKAAQTRRHQSVPRHGPARDIPRIVAPRRQLVESRLPGRRLVTWYHPARWCRRASARGLDVTRYILGREVHVHPRRQRGMPASVDGTVDLSNPSSTRRTSRRPSTSSSGMLVPPARCCPVGGRASRTSRSPRAGSVAGRLSRPSTSTSPASGGKRTRSSTTSAVRSSAGGPTTGTG
jgi:hypothetical protein